MAVDDNFTVALLHMDGADASTTFTDESGKTWTANGNAQIDTAQSVFGGASGLFDGTGDYISSADSADWQLDGGADSNEWTIDFWVRFNGDPGAANMPLMSQYTDGNNYWVCMLSVNNMRFLCVSGGATIISISNAWNPATATWYHLAFVKQGTTGYKFFVDGTQVGTTQTDTSTIPNFTSVITAGGGMYSGALAYLNGWMDEVRVSKGVARWTANFTPPTSAYAPPQTLFPRVMLT